MTLRWVGLGLVVASLVCAAPASADTDSYVSAVQGRYVSLPTQQVLAAGTRACSIILSGNPASVAVDTLNREMDFSVPIAFDIVSAAVRHLGC